MKSAIKYLNPSLTGIAGKTFEEIPSRNFKKCSKSIFPLELEAPPSCLELSAIEVENICLDIEDFSNMDLPYIDLIIETPPMRDWLI